MDIGKDIAVHGHRKGRFDGSFNFFVMMMKKWNGNPLKDMKGVVRKVCVTTNQPLFTTSVKWVPWKGYYASFFKIPSGLNIGNIYFSFLI